MGDVVIKVENLSKEYRLGTISHGTLYSDLQSWWARIRGKEDPNSIISTHQTVNYSTGNPHILALNDISFEVKCGEVLGIIGRNGAGKSTLLKILSRITAPTKGVVKINGRIASLLEVGTGFHPELTGRENIILNGAILGMRNAEIIRKLDEIVAFSEIEKFLDTPVKRYSSGMYVRLAFAVAAHLEPEILIIDEVLAVGDAAFQKKCLGKMGEVAKGGRTVLFVSHNMNAIEQLCKSALLLDKGELKYGSADVRGVIKKYLFTQDGNESVEWINEGHEHDSPWFKPLRFFISDEHGNKLSMPVSNNSGMWIQIEGEIKETDIALTVGYAIYAEDGNLLYWSYQTDVAEDHWPKLRKGLNILRSRLPNRLFNDGVYRIEIISSLHYREWLCEPGKNAPAVYVAIQGGLSDSPYWMVKRPGILAPVIEWKRVANSLDCGL